MGEGGNSSPSQLDSDRSSFSSSSLFIRLEDLFALDKRSRFFANLIGTVRTRIRVMITIER